MVGPDSRAFGSVSALGWEIRGCRGDGTCGEGGLGLVPGKERRGCRSSKCDKGLRWTGDVPCAKLMLNGDACRGISKKDTAFGEASDWFSGECFVGEAWVEVTVSLAIASMDSDDRSDAEYGDFGETAFSCDSGLACALGRIMLGPGEDAKWVRLPWLRLKP